VSFFSLFRNESLNALTQSERNAGQTDPSPYDRKQYGGSFGGPIVKDKAHFFVAIERNQQEQQSFVDSGGIFPNLDGISVGLPTRETLGTAKFTANFDP